MPEISYDLALAYLGYHDIDLAEAAYRSALAHARGTVLLNAIKNLERASTIIADSDAVDEFLSWLRSKNGLNP